MGRKRKREVKNVLLKVVFEADKKVWTKDGLPHRLDGPAIEYKNGDKEWYINGVRHREDGPAVERKNGDVEWYLNGKKILSL